MSPKVIVVLVLAGVAMFASAGSLNPPPGPITPTMHTLDEVYDAAAGCVKCTWQYKYIGSTETVEAVPGSGILHGIWLYGLSQNTNLVQVSNGPPTDNDMIGKFDAPVFTAGTGHSEFMPPQFISLDVPFQNGLYVYAPNAKITLLYRSSP